MEEKTAEHNFQRRLIDGHMVTGLLELRKQNLELAVEKNKSTDFLCRSLQGHRDGHLQAGNGKSFLQGIWPNQEERPEDSDIRSSLMASWVPAGKATGGGYPHMQTFRLVCN